jgi:hypothetical protein
LRQTRFSAEPQGLHPRQRLAHIYQQALEPPMQYQALPVLAELDQQLCTVQLF